MKINDDDYLRRVKNYDEILENEKVKQFIANELNCEIVSIVAIDELDGMYYLNGRAEENGELFLFKIMFYMNEKYKNLSIRKESISSPSFSFLDMSYSMDKKTSFVKIQKGSLQDKKHYFVENLVNDGEHISYCSDLYWYDKIKSIFNFRGKSMYSMEAIKSYSLDNLIIDNIFQNGLNEYRIFHNGKTSYITSDNLNESIDDLLSNNIHITLDLK